MLEVDVLIRRGAFRVEAAFASNAPIVALFGRSGTGKSSLVHAIAGIVRPERGRIVVGGRTLFDSSRGIDLVPEARRVGYVFQDALLFPHMSVRANLAYGESLTPPAERFIDSRRVLALLGLEALLERRPGSLSGGERQRVAIGRALLASPRVLLLDEPLASLDGARKAEILAYIELLRDELGLPMVYVSHALEEVTRLADHVVVIGEGRVLAEGGVAEVLSRPEVGGIAGRYEAGTVVDAVVARIDERYDLTTLEFAGGALVVPNLDALPGSRVRVRLRARDISLALTRPSGLSIQNVLAARVHSLAGEFGAMIDVHLETGGVALLARVTRKAADELGLAPGLEVLALVKAVSIDRHSAGFA
jgi:molybdate transport system ATP-binding protein